MRTTVIIFGVFQVLLTLKLSFNNAVEFTLTNAKCETYNKSLFLIHQCSVEKVNLNRSGFNFNGTFLHPVDNIRIQLQLLKKANWYKPWLYNVTIDACRFLRQPYNPIVSIVYKLVKDFSNINHTCPYMGPQIIKGFYLRLDLMRLPLPTGDYLLEMTWYFYKKRTFATNVYFKFVEDL